MKTIVAGSREGHLTPTDIEWLDTLGITELVSGGCSGIDADAEAWAKSRGIPIKKFEANWKLYGRSAGPIRNNEMAQYAERCVLFPGGKGTKDMRRNAIESGIPVIERNHIKYCLTANLWKYNSLVAVSKKPNPDPMFGPVEGNVSKELADEMVRLGLAQWSEQQKTE